MFLEPNGFISQIHRCCIPRSFLALSQPGMWEFFDVGISQCQKSCRISFLTNVGISLASEFFSGSH